MSNDTINCRINCISNNILKQVMEELKASPFPFSMQLDESTDVLQTVNNFFAKQDFNWKRNIGNLCADGAPSMLGKTSGFATLVKKEAPQIIVTHCFLHRHALASKTLPSNLQEILSTSVKVVNISELEL